ncbi:MAG TPA: hypothetical protein VE076_08860 [Nitrososphaeraceae archaeon]|nr:hypothetical protein [Nitrososphaeraceae archaeon]
MKIDTASVAQISRQKLTKNKGYQAEEEEEEMMEKQRPCIELALALGYF